MGVRYETVIMSGTIAYRAVPSWDVRLIRMDQFTQRVAAEIRSEAERQGIWSQSELARRAGIPVATVRRYFYAEEREPTVDAVRAVANALGLSGSAIFARAEAAEVTPAETPVVRRVTARNIRSTERLPRTVE